MRVFHRGTPVGQIKVRLFAVLEREHPRETDYWTAHDGGVLGIGGGQRENMRCIPHRGIDDFGMEAGVLVGHVGIKRHARIIAVLRFTCPVASPRPPAR